ncbi:hypothetical protein VDGL01_06683 [Verticillium dahliae]
MCNPEQSPHLICARWRDTSQDQWHGMRRPRYPGGEGALCGTCMCSNEQHQHQHGQEEQVHKHEQLQCSASAPPRAPPRAAHDVRSGEDCLPATFGPATARATPVLRRKWFRWGDDQVPATSQAPLGPHDGLPTTASQRDSAKHRIVAVAGAYPSKPLAFLLASMGQAAQ